MRVEAIQRVQRRLAIKVINEKEHQFENLMSLIGRPDWIEYALRKVLENKGSKTAGIDGWNKQSFLNSERKISQAKIDVAVVHIRNSLKKYKPKPVKRVYIPKSAGDKRPLGIPTLFDRTVQMTIKMILEPIYESDFLDCSYGFRPRRSTFQILHPLRNVVNRSKYHWVIEGDIAKCFDEVNHEILLRILGRRIKDRKILRIIKAMLKAGIMEDGLFRDSELGTPQGGVVSPLLANIYLHEFDLWWYKKWGKLTRKQRYIRRKKGLGHFKLIRYADDFLVLSNARKELVNQMRERIKDFLENQLKLRLSMEKTKITHVKDGFEFLGWYFMWTVNRLTNKGFLLSRPTKRSVKKFKRKIKELTHRSTVNHNFRSKLQVINRIVRGWGNYYRYTNARQTFDSLNWYVNQRIGKWLKAKTGKGIMYCLKEYRILSRGQWIWGVKGFEGTKPVWLFRITNIPVTTDARKIPKHLRSTPKGNPYIDDFETITHNSDPLWRVENRLFEPWLGQRIYKDSEWASQRVRTIKHDHSRCVECGAITSKLEVHHRTRRDIGRAKRTLCRQCHQEYHRTRMQ